jgi:hypothetical protein
LCFTILLLVGHHCCDWNWPFTTMPTVHLLDYVAGNVRSLVNAINKVGYDVEWVRSPSDLKDVEVWTILLLEMLFFQWRPD